MARISVDDGFCKGCGLCVDACPVGIIEYVDALPKTVNGMIRRAAIREADERKEREVPEGLI